MALKVLMLRKKKENLTKQLEQLRSKIPDFKKREKELEGAIEEVDDKTTKEEQEALNEEVEKLEKDKNENNQNIDDLEKQINDIEEEIKKEEEKQPKPQEKGDDKRSKKLGGEEKMSVRTKFFGMNIQERDAFFAREDVKSFIENVRTCIKEKRALTNVGLTIPEVMLDLLKQKVEETSKLLKYVQKRPVAGTARQVIMGEIPEAVWTEMCAVLNELSLGFNDIEVDGYKVGGYFSVCNAILEDNDVNLVTEIINALGRSIGKALDKAIVYGKGTKMPLGIVTRLAQRTKPTDYPATARTWKDLSTSNVLTGTGKTGVALFKEIVGHTGAIINDYSEKGLVWLMNKKTHIKLITESMDKNLNAAIVSGINNQMPVVGGAIEELSFIPDDNIVFGYLDMYLLAERAGTTIGQSEHYRFIEDKTIFKGTARYDGKPVIPESFAVLSIGTTAPATSVTFPSDEANTPKDEE